MKLIILVLVGCFFFFPNFLFGKDDNTRMKEIKEVIKDIGINPEKVREEGYEKLTENMFNIESNSTIENDLLPLLISSLQTENYDQVFFILYQLHWFYCNKIGGLIYDNKEIPNLSLPLSQQELLNRKIIEVIENTEEELYIPYSVLD